jgi:hypothetical protein
MHKQQKFLLAIVLIGGVAVLGSYAWGILAIQNATQILWGDVPAIIRSFSTVGMFTGALGFFAYSFFILFKLNPDNTRIYSHFGYTIFNYLYLAILIPSALWLPLTFLAVQNNHSMVLWLARLDLIVVAAASILLFLALLFTQPHRSVWAYWLAMVGSIFFCIQTVLLDAILWGYFFGFG